MNILITGGMGSIGSRLLVPLVRRGDQIVLFDVRSEPHFASDEYAKTHTISCDLGDRSALFETIRSFKIESVFHLGAVLSSAAEDRPTDAWKSNMDGMIHLLDASRACGVRKVVFASTIATYGRGLPMPLNLDAPQWPMSLYGVTKVAGERLGYYYYHRFGLEFRAIRLPVVLAPRAATGAASGFCSAVFEECVNRGRYEFYVHPYTRLPMLYVVDVIRGLVQLHDMPSEKLLRKVYNIAGINPSAEELANVIQKRLAGVLISYKPDPIRTAIVESWPYDIDDSAAVRDWNWRVEWNLERIADDMIEVLQHEHTG